MLLHKYLLVVRWIFKICDLVEILLDVADADEPVQDVTTAGFVVCTAHSCTTKPLLGHNGSCTLVVDVKVTGTVSECFAGLVDRFTVLGEDGACEAVDTGGID